MICNKLDLQVDLVSTYGVCLNGHSVLVQLKPSAHPPNLQVGQEDIIEVNGGGVDRFFSCMAVMRPGLRATRVRAPCAGHCRHWCPDT